MLTCALARYPWKTQSSPGDGGGYWGLTNSILTGSLPELPPERFSPECRSFIRECLCRDPEARPTAHALLRHPFFELHREQLRVPPGEDATEHGGEEASTREAVSVRRSSVSVIEESIAQSTEFGEESISEHLSASLLSLSRSAMGGMVGTGGGMTSAGAGGGGAGSGVLLGRSGFDAQLSPVSSHEPTSPHSNSSASLTSLGASTSQRLGTIISKYVRWAQSAREEGVGGGGGFVGKSAGGPDRLDLQRLAEQLGVPVGAVVRRFEERV